jgi:hypothetical protein
VIGKAEGLPDYNNNMIIAKHKKVSNHIGKLKENERWTRTN